MWTRYGARDGWSWVRQLGTTSLLVYWVHIELVYGRWLWFFKNNLNVPQVLVAATVVILLMLGISTLEDVSPPRRHDAGRDGLELRAEARPGARRLAGS